MKIHDIYDIVYSVKIAGLNNEHQLVRTFFMRSGKRLLYTSIQEIYFEITKVMNSLGYSDFFDFLKDYFPDEDFKKIRISNKNLNVKLTLNSPAINLPIEPAIISSPLLAAVQNEKEEIKTQPFQIEKNETISKEPASIKPIRIIKDDLGSERNEYEITPKDKARTIKNKKLSKKFREMDQREKEIDNRYDYFIHRSKVTEQKLNFKGKNKEGTSENSNLPIVDNREALKKNPFMGTFYGDLDLEFREIMFKIYKFNKNKTKDKTQYAAEMGFLEKYFYKKLHIGKKEDDSVKKLTNAVAYLMKKLQNKIFETEDKKQIEYMLYFKSKLYLFYNYYRK
jgi:hypothetical protein